VSEFLQEKLSEIDKRLEELRPLVEEFHSLEAARAALDQVGAERRGARRGGRRRTTTGAGRTRGRRRGTGQRALQTLELVRQSPQGITIPELAAKMGMRQNYLYRVLPSLHKEGKVRKRGRLWFPVEEEQSEAA